MGYDPAEVRFQRLGRGKYAFQDRKVRIRFSSVSLAFRSFSDARSKGFSRAAGNSVLLSMVQSDVPLGFHHRARNAWHRFRLEPRGKGHF